jgi:hypothetical protein
VSSWQFRGLAFSAREKLVWWTVAANGGTADALLAAVEASPARPTREQAGKALLAWFEAALDAEEGTAAWSRRYRRGGMVSEESPEDEVL